MDDYFQESGRVGRDRKQSHAILFNYKGNFGKGKMDEAMREYVNSTDKCHRELLLKHYEQQSSTLPVVMYKVGPISICFTPRR